MKQFLLKCVTLLLICASVLYLSGVAYKQTTTWKNLEQDEETEKFYEMPEVIDFAVVGPSHGRNAFRQADYGDGFFNFSMSSQTPQYDLMQLRQFAGRIQPGATVVLTVSYLSPFWTETKEKFDSKQERYYRIFQPQYIVDCDTAHWYLGRFSPLLTTDVRDVLNAVLNPPQLREDSNTVLQEVDLASERDRIKRNHLGVISPAMPDGNPVMLDAYQEMLALCRENGWNTVLVTPPYPTVYTDCFSPEILTAFRRLTAQISEANDVPWFDYAQHPEFTENLFYFEDIDHLNSVGAARFAEIVHSDLEENGLWSVKQ